MGSVVGGLVGNMIAPGIGGVIGSALGGAVDSGNSASAAADAQTAAANQSNETQRYIFDRQTQLQEPFRQAGLKAQSNLLDLLGLSGNAGSQGYGSLMKDFSQQDFQQDPGYAFRMSEGQKALERSAAARGGLLSGRAAKDMARFGQDLGSQEYQNAFNRFQVNRSNKLNPLQSLLGVGQTSANTLTGAAGNYGANVSATQQGLGNALGAAQIARGSSYANAGSQIGKAFQQQGLMNQLFGNTSNAGIAGFPAASYYDDQGF